MDTPPQFSETFRQALAVSAAGDSEQAIELFRRAIDEQPGFALPAFLLGAEFAQLGRIDEALQAYAAAVLLAPELHIARFQLGLLQFTSGQAALALITWQPLLQLPETHALREFVLGFAALAEDQFDAALVRFKAGQALNTENAPLNGDIQMLIGKIEALRAQTVAEAGPAVTPEAAPDENPADASHVLLSNYRGGSYH